MSGEKYHRPASDRTHHVGIGRNSPRSFNDPFLLKNQSIHLIKPRPADHSQWRERFCICCARNVPCSFHQHPFLYNQKTTESLPEPQSSHYIPTNQKRTNQFLATDPGTSHIELHDRTEINFARVAMNRTWFPSEECGSGKLLFSRMLSRNCPVKTIQWGPCAETMSFAVWQTAASSAGCSSMLRLFRFLQGYIAGFPCTPSY